MWHKVATLVLRDYIPNRCRKTVARTGPKTCEMLLGSPKKHKFNKCDCDNSNNGQHYDNLNPSENRERLVVFYLARRP